MPNIMPNIHSPKHKKYTCQVSSTFTGRSLLDDSGDGSSFNNSGIRNINNESITNGGGRGRMEANVPLSVPSPNPASKVSFYPRIYLRILLTGVTT